MCLAGWSSSKLGQIGCGIGACECVCVCVRGGEKIECVDVCVCAINACECVRYLVSISVRQR